MTDPPASDPWLPAERAADLDRYARLHPTGGERRADLVLKPLLVLVAVLALGAAVAGLLGQPWSRAAAGYAEGGAFLLFALGMTWAWMTRRLALRGATEIRNALPPHAWPALRRQILGRDPLEPAQADIALELAHQERRRLQGLLPLLGWYLPLELGIAVATPAWTDILTAIGLVVLVIALVVGVRDHVRIGRVIAAEEARIRSSASA